MIPSFPRSKSLLLVLGLAFLSSQVDAASPAKENPLAIFPATNCNVETALKNLNAYLATNNPRPTYDGDNPWRVIPDLLVNPDRGVLVDISFQAGDDRRSGTFKVVFRSLCGTSSDYLQNAIYAEGARYITRAEFDNPSSPFLQVSLQNYSLNGKNLVVSIRGHAVEKANYRADFVVTSDGTSLVRLDPHSEPVRVPNIVDAFLAEKP